MPDPQYTIDDMLRIGAENSRLKARIAELEQRLTDDQITAFSLQYVLKGVHVTKPINVYAMLREFRRLG